MNARFIVEDATVKVPEWVNDLESFRRWSDDDDFPEYGRICYLRGEVWIDMSKEQLFSHNQVKNEIAFTITGLVKARRLGRYFCDGAYVSNVEADVSNKPDGMFVSAESIRSGRVRIVEGRMDGYVELEGSPDLVIEVMSGSSVEKDTEILRTAYAVAGIREYWLIDARAQPIRFDLLRLSRGAYVATRKRGGWLRSDVLGAEFRLSVATGDDGFPAFALESRPVGG